jgi:hypothetical protein
MVIGTGQNGTWTLAESGQQEAAGEDEDNLGEQAVGGLRPEAGGEDWCIDTVSFSG